MRLAGRILVLMKILGYLAILLSKFIYLSLVYMWYRFIYGIKWRLALRRTRHILMASGIPKAEADRLARRITAPPPSLWGFVRRIRRL